MYHRRVRSLHNSWLGRSRAGLAAILALCLVGGIAAGVGVSLALRPHAPAQTQPLTPAGPVIGADLARQYAAPFTLTDQNGVPISLTAQKGKLVLLAFMDPLCVQLCPILGRQIASVEAQLPRGIDPELLVVSVTAGRTASDVRHFVKTNLTQQWRPGWHWLLGPSEAALKLTWLHWGVPLTPPHDNTLSVIDAQGYLRVTYPAPIFVGDVVSAITTVARG